ncbi:DMT family transporter [Acuticoccus sp.]|uniref:DMT family transporter n=1 Tax=Acuticoccus sp. TaxID=1904378 RepID=UPI003B522074
MALNDNARGALMMSVAMVGFAVNDALMKLAFEAVPLGQGLLVRGIVAAILVALIAHRAGALAFRPNRREAAALSLRMLGEIGGVLTFLTALQRLPLAEASAILQATPLAVTMAAALLLSEPVGWRRWSAIVVGFVGVLVMVRPGGEAFTWWTLLPVATVACVTVRDLATRTMSRATPSLFAATTTAVGVTLAGMLVMPFDEPAPWTGTAFAACVGAGLASVVGYILIVSAIRIGDVSTVAPFRYTVLLYALILGYLVFGEVPDGATLLGAAIIVAAGLYTLWREQVLGRRRIAATAPTRPTADAEPDA